MNKENEVKVNEIVNRIMRDDIYTNVDSMTRYILDKSFECDDVPFSWDDVENMGSPDYDSMEEEELDEINEDMHGEDFSGYDFDDKVSYLQDNFEDSEIFEWWAVSNWLAQKLQEQGETVILGDDIWGRQTTGQAIKLDGIIQRIAQSIL